MSIWSGYFLFGQLVGVKEGICLLEWFLKLIFFDVWYVEYGIDICEI